MDKKITLITVAAVIAVVLGIVVFKQPKTAVNDTSNNSSNSVNKPAVDPAISALPVKIVKIQGQVITYASFDKEKTVTVGSDTQIVKQVNEKGVVKDVEIQLSDLKPSQMIQITFGSSASQAKTIRLLK